MNYKYLIFLGILICGAPSSRAAFKGEMRVEDCSKELRTSCLEDLARCRAKISSLIANRPHRDFRFFQKKLFKNFSNRDRLSLHFLLQPQSSQEKEFRFQVFKDFIAEISAYPEFKSQKIDLQSLFERHVKRFRYGNHRVRLTHGSNLESFENIKREGFKMSPTSADAEFAVSLAANNLAHSSAYARGHEEGAVHLELGLHAKTILVNFDTAFTHPLIAGLVGKFFDGSNHLPNRSRELLNQLYPELKNEKHISVQILTYLIGADGMGTNVHYYGVDAVFEYALFDPALIAQVKRIPLSNRPSPL